MLEVSREMLGKFVTYDNDVWLKRTELEETERCYVKVYSFHDLVAIVRVQLFEVELVPES